MKTQTKCTLTIVGLFIIELLPVPFSSIYSIYAVRRRPDWLPKVVDNLYAEKENHAIETINHLNYAGHDHTITRKKCTYTVVGLFAIDLIVPVVIPTAFYVVRTRPEWFRTLVFKLYSDKLFGQSHHNQAVPETVLSDELKRKLLELDANNLAIANSLVNKTNRGKI